jgi:hypothetical protein
LITVGSEQPSNAVISSPFKPAPAHSTIRARSAIRTSELDARTIRSNSARSASDTKIRFTTPIADLHPRPTGRQGLPVVRRNTFSPK